MKTNNQSGKGNALFIDTENGPVRIPSRFEVCPRCEGHGKVDHPAFSNGLTESDFAEDEDFRENYFAGRYDVCCPECDGKRVTLVPDEDRMTEGQREALAEFYRGRAEDAYFKRMRERGIEF